MKSKDGKSASETFHKYFLLEWDKWFKFIRDELIYMLNKQRNKKWASFDHYKESYIKVQPMGINTHRASGELSLVLLMQFFHEELLDNFERKEHKRNMRFFAEDYGLNPNEPLYKQMKFYTLYNEPEYAALLQSPTTKQLLKKREVSAEEALDPIMRKRIGRTDFTYHVVKLLKKSTKNFDTYKIGFSDDKPWIIEWVVEQSKLLTKEDELKEFDFHHFHVDPSKRDIHKETVIRKKAGQS